MANAPFETRTLKLDARPSGTVRDRNRHLPDAVQQENEQLNKGLRNVRPNLAEPFSVNGRESANCSEIESHCQHMSDPSQTIRKDLSKSNQTVIPQRQSAEPTVDQLPSIGDVADSIQDIAGPPNLLTPDPST